MIAAGGYTLNGNAVTIANVQGITANYVSGATSTINLAVSANGFTIDVVQTGSRLVFGGNVNSLGNLFKTGTGTAVLLAPGMMGSSWTVGAGILNLQHGGITGNLGNIKPGATFQVQGGIAFSLPIRLDGGTGAANATGAVESMSGTNTLTGGIIVFANSTISADAGSSLTVSTNPVRLGTFTLTADVAGAVTIASTIQDSGGLIKTGTGPLTLSGANTYTGPTTVNAGTLLVNGNQPSSSVTVNSGGTLGGTGTTGPVTVNSIVNPGVGGPGVLQTRNATFNGGSTFTVDLSGTTVGSGHDQLSVAGTVTLMGPTLNLSVGFPSATGDVFVIIQSTGAISGAFCGLPEGSTFTIAGRTFRINYTTNAVTLTDVTPTPSPTPTPTVTLTPTPPPGSCILGDINCDGSVDIRDYGLWRLHFGETAGAGAPGRGATAALVGGLNADGIVDIRDNGIWRTNFGHTAGAALRGETGSPSAGATPTRSSGRPRFN